MGGVVKDMRTVGRSLLKGRGGTRIPSLPKCPLLSLLLSFETHSRLFEFLFIHSILATRGNIYLISTFFIEKTLFKFTFLANFVLNKRRRLMGKKSISSLLELKSPLFNESN